MNFRIFSQSKILFFAAISLSLALANHVAAQGTAADQSNPAVEGGAKMPAAEATTVGPDPHAGHNHGVSTANEIGQEEDPAARKQPTTEEIIEQFKAQVPPEILPEGMAAIELFNKKLIEFREAVVEMRKLHTLYANRYEDDKEPYIESRDEARRLMNETYHAALHVTNYLPHPDALRYMVTIVEQRVKLGIYQRDTLEGAAKLLDFGGRLRYVAQAAARSAIVAGDFQLAELIYERLEDDELEDIDRRLIAETEILKIQFEAEQKLLEKDPEDLPRVRFRTSRGDIVAELFINEAPSTVAHFIGLVESGFYDGLDFFQVVKNLLALTGDPLGDGSSRPDHFLADEHERPVVRMPLRGSLVMAKLPAEDKSFVANSAGTQFAILLMPLPGITRHQTVFGRVVEGKDLLGALRLVDPTKKKEKDAIVVPPDRILECEIINRPAELPEVQYADLVAPMPQGPVAPGN